MRVVLEHIAAYNEPPTLGHLSEQIPDTDDAELLKIREYILMAKQPIATLDPNNPAQYPLWVEEVEPDVWELTEAGARLLEEVSK
jgi:hypothetical protein